MRSSRRARPPCISTDVSRTSPPASLASTSTNKGFCIDENGCLQIEMEDGLPIVVSPRGAQLTPHQNLAANKNNNHMLEGSIRWEDLKLGHVIGQGSQAVVRKVKHMPSGIVYAMKRIELSPASVFEEASAADEEEGDISGSGDARSDGNNCLQANARVGGRGHNNNGHSGSAGSLKKVLQRELSRLAAASHPNIVSYHEAFFFDNNIKLLMEYVNLGPLSSLIRSVGPLPMGIMSPLIKQVVNGLKSLHESGILHRDLKPSNLLVTKKGVVKISDFGVSTMLARHNGRDNIALTQIGSTAYMSPERIRGDPHGPPSDIWALGVTCAECVLGVYPLLPGLDELGFCSIADDDDDEEPSNPFDRPLNMFDLSMMIAENHAEVKWDRLLTLISEYELDHPTPRISEECMDFVAKCMRQDPLKRAPLTVLELHLFLSATVEMDFVPWLHERLAAKSETVTPSSSIGPPSTHRLCSALPLSPFLSAVRTSDMPTVPTACDLSGGNGGVGSLSLAPSP